MKDRDPFEEYFKTQLEQEAGIKIPSIVIREEDDPAKKKDEPEEKKDDPEVPIDMTHKPAEPRGGTFSLKDFVKGGGAIGAAGRGLGIGNPLDYLKNTALGKKAKEWMDSGVGDFAKTVLGDIAKKAFNAYMPYGNYEGAKATLVEIRGSDIIPGIIENVLGGRLDSEEHKIFASSMAAKNNNITPRIAALHPAYYEFIRDYVNTKGTVLPMHSARLSTWRMAPRYSITAAPSTTEVRPLKGNWGGPHDTLRFALEAIEAWPGGEAPFVHTAINAPNQKLKLVNYADPPEQTEDEKDAEAVSGSDPYGGGDGSEAAESIEAAYGQIINEVETAAGSPFELPDVSTGGERTEVGADGGAVEPEVTAAAPAAAPAEEEEDKYYGPPSEEPVKDNIFIQKVQEEFYKGDGIYKDPKKRTKETAYSIVRSSLAGASQTHGGMKLTDGTMLGMHELEELAAGVSDDHYIIKHSDLRVPEDELVKTFINRLAGNGGEPIELGEGDVNFVRLQTYILRQGNEAQQAWDSGAGHIKTLIGDKEYLLRFERPAGPDDEGKLLWKFTILPDEGGAVTPKSGVKSLF